MNTFPTSGYFSVTLAETKIPTEVIMFIFNECKGMQVLNKNGRTICFGLLTSEQHYLGPTKNIECTRQPKYKWSISMFR